MTTNLGDRDRTLRLLTAAAMSWVAIRAFAYGTTRTTLLVIALWLLATSLVGWDPLYALFRVSTMKSPKSPR